MTTVSFSEQLAEWLKKEEAILNSPEWAELKKWAEEVKRRKQEVCNGSIK